MTLYETLVALGTAAGAIVLVVLLLLFLLWVLFQVSKWLV